MFNVILFYETLCNGNSLCASCRDRRLQQDTNATRHSRDVRTIVRTRPRTVPRRALYRRPDAAAGRCRFAGDDASGQHQSRRRRTAVGQHRQPVPAHGYVRGSQSRQLARHGHSRSQGPGTTSGPVAHARHDIRDNQSTRLPADMPSPCRRVMLAGREREMAPQ